MPTIARVIELAAIFLHSILHHRHHHHLSHISSGLNKAGLEKFNHFTCQLPGAGSRRRCFQIKWPKNEIDY